jgi:hypothetical protein
MLDELTEEQGLALLKAIESMENGEMPSDKPRTNLH